MKIGGLPFGSGKTRSPGLVFMVLCHCSWIENELLSHSEYYVIAINSFKHSVV